MTLQLQGQLIGEFHSIDSWLKNAVQMLTPFKGEPYVCIDAAGYICHSAEDIAAVYENDRFPIKAYQVTKSKEVQEATAI